MFGVKTRKLLFRAPGVDKHQPESTAVESIEAIREGRTDSFAAAMANMTANLSAELSNFEDRLETEPQLVQVNWSESSGRGGGGSMGLSLLVLLLFLHLIGEHTRTRAIKDADG